MQLSDTRRSRFGFHNHIEDATDVPEPVALRLAQARLIEPHTPIRVMGNARPPIRNLPRPPSPVLAPGTRTVVPKEGRVVGPTAPHGEVETQRLDDVFTIEPVARVRRPEPTKRRLLSPMILLGAFLFLATIPPIVAVVAASYDAGISLGTLVESIWTLPQR